jgi:quercetin dioxygenase-like cupin family protein
MSVIHRFKGKKNNYLWEDVPVREYEKEFEGVTRQVVIGPDDDSNNFHLRYFRLEPGKHSNLERHPHEHGVIILHGKARVQLNDDFSEIGPNDAVFISGNDLHQFTAIGDEPLGFLCVIKDKNS